jgi:hypothetical protein
MFLLQGPPVDVGGYYKPDPVKESIRLLPFYMDLMSILGLES